MYFKGIRLDILVRSGFVPVLPALLSQWKGKGRPAKAVDITDTRWGMLNSTVTVALIMMTLLVYENPTYDMALAVLTLVTWLVLFGLLKFLSLRRAIGPFIRAVKELDRLLIKNGYIGGVAKLPHVPKELEEVLQRVIQTQRAAIRKMEDEQGERDANEIDQKDRDLRELARLWRERFYCPPLPPSSRPKVIPMAGTK